MTAKELFEQVIDRYETECQRLTAQVAKLTERVYELERMYKGVVELNERNANDALRRIQAGDAAFTIAVAAFDGLRAKDERIAELEAENRELERMVSLETIQAFEKGSTDE